MSEQLTFDFLQAPDPMEPLKVVAGSRLGPSLDAVREMALSCSSCGLRKGCRGVVFGEGSPSARLMLVGEAPGGTEDELGRPFVGKAGQLLDRILEASGFRRSDTYITNTCKCRPPGNRTPQPEEAEACRPWLAAQLYLIRPQVLVCLGAAAARNIIDPGLKITRDRGRWHDLWGMKVIATFHPAALLRDPSKKKPVWDDFRAIRDLLAGQ